MIRKYKTSWKTGRRVNRFHVEFSDQPPMDDKQRLIANIAREEEFIEKYPNYSVRCDEAKSRLKSYREKLKAIQDKEDEQNALAHIDSLIGDERLTVNQMIDATELFTRNYNNKHVPGSVCPKCGGELIVKERRLRQRGKDDYVTNFVACCMFERTGCNYTEEFTAEIKKSIDSVVCSVEVDF